MTSSWCSAGILAMFCEMCRDAALHGDGPPRFGGIFEMYANSTADPAFWGERWELYKVRHSVFEVIASPLHTLRLYASSRMPQTNRYL